MELGLFAALRDAGEQGLTPDELAERARIHPLSARYFAWAADAHDLVVFEDGRVTSIDDVATILLDADRPEYLGGQFLHATTASLDYAGLVEFFRTGRPIEHRPDRYRVAIERLTVQDVAVFFQEVLAAEPQLVADLRPGSRIVDVHCGGGRWLIAMARQFPGTELVGIEFEPDSIARAQANVEAAGLADRIRIEPRDATKIAHPGEFDLAYFQYALHQLDDPANAIRAAWAAIRPGGRIVALDWYLPSDPAEFRSRHGELIAGVQLDELYQGTRLVRRQEALAWFEQAGVPAPALLDLPSGATAIIATRTAT